jgi:hypothetical protein
MARNPCAWKAVDLRVGHGLFVLEAARGMREARAQYGADFETVAATGANQLCGRVILAHSTCLCEILKVRGMVVNKRKNAGIRIGVGVGVDPLPPIK